MNRQHFASQLRAILSSDPGPVEDNFLEFDRAASSTGNQEQTTDVFSTKWAKYETSGEKDRLYEMQRRWYLDLYGFVSEAELAEFLGTRRIIFDAGCGLGYKAAWFASLAPNSLVIGMDASEAARQAADAYRAIPNLFFLQGDIARSHFGDGSIDYVSCDQVIMHTERPEETLAELTRITAAPDGQFACYFYAKKALPRELLDDHFRMKCTQMTQEEIWRLAEQVTELGKRLAALGVSIESPEIPALGIRAGRYDIQRFIYWNFLKCFWSESLGPETSVVVNFDWYSPSNARRFSEEEVRNLLDANGLQVIHFHKEEACYSGRFRAAGRRASLR